MKALKCYIKESLLDSEDELDKNADNAVINLILKNIDESISKHQRRRHDAVISTVEGSELKFIEGTYAQITDDVLENIIDLQKLTNIDAITFESENIFSKHKVDGLIEIRRCYDFSKHIKTINTPRIKFICQKNISDLTINLFPVQGSLHPSFFAEYNLSDEVKNVNINMRTMGGSVLCNAMKFSYIPKFINCKIIGVLAVRVYDPSLFMDSDVKKLFDKFLDVNYKAPYDDTKTKDVVYRKGNITTLRASLVNKRRYVYDHHTPLFKINPNAKLNDIINIDNFDDKLIDITLRDNGVCIHFVKYPPYGVEPCKVQQLPNDPDWHMYIEREN